MFAVADFLFLKYWVKFLFWYTPFQQVVYSLKELLRYP